MSADARRGRSWNDCDRRTKHRRELEGRTQLRSAAGEERSYQDGAMVCDDRHRIRAMARVESARFGRMLCMHGTRRLISATGSAGSGHRPAAGRCRADDHAAQEESAEEADRNAIAQHQKAFYRPASNPQLRNGDELDARGRSPRRIAGCRRVFIYEAGNRSLYFPPSISDLRGAQCCMHTALNPKTKS
jgi:hypothetical protein